MMLFKYEENMKFVTCLQDLSTYYNQEIGVNLLFMSTTFICVKVRSWLSEKWCVKYWLTPLEIISGYLYSTEQFI